MEGGGRREENNLGNGSPVGKCGRLGVMKENFQTHFCLFGTMQSWQRKNSPLSEGLFKKVEEDREGKFETYFIKMSWGMIETEPGEIAR